MFDFCAMETAAGLSQLAKWGVGIALCAILFPAIAIGAWVVGAVLLIRGEVGPGLGIGFLGTLCGLLGLLLVASL